MCGDINTSTSATHIDPTPSKQHRAEAIATIKSSIVSHRLLVDVAWIEWRSSSASGRCVVVGSESVSVDRGLRRRDDQKLPEMHEFAAHILDLAGEASGQLVEIALN